MLGKSIRLFRVFGFDIKVDLSWIFIAVLITWSLATGYFPKTTPHLPNDMYWRMGVFGALGLFFSIIFHELHHSLVARHYGIKIRGITLFIFGGVAEMENEPPTAVSEFWIAIAGPISSLYLSGGFFLINFFKTDLGISLSVTAVIGYLATINLVLAIFNMIPAFPLDGGRVLRAFLWKLRGNLKEATITASRSGNFFGTLFIVMALFNFIASNFIGAVWWFLIGLFLKNAANMSLQQLMIKKVLQGEPVSRFMTKNPVSLDLSMSIKQVVEDYIYTTHHKMYPIINHGLLAGILTTKQIKEIPSENWDTTTVAEIMLPVSPDNTIAPDVDTMDALAMMNRTNNSRLIVVEKNQVLGILVLKDILELLSLKIDLDTDN